MRSNTLIVISLIAALLMAMVQVHLFEIAFTKLGISREVSVLLLIGSVLGSMINLPLYSVTTQTQGHLVWLQNRKPVWEIYQPARVGKTVIAVNVGGCVLPVGLCVYFMSLQLLNPLNCLIGVAVVAALSYRFSRVIPGLGVAMPVFITPLVAVLVALGLEPEHVAQLAYISGVFGVLIGADLLRLNAITAIGAPVAAIGGAGTFDGIFLTGMIAALLA